jgi:colanic acid biosynthesis glycosyl transferase WcaI
MRCLVVGLNYPPESTAGPYTADLAVHLKRCGHDVAVATGFPTAPSWKVWEGYEGRLWMREVIDGVPVLRTYLYVPKDPRKTLQRVLFDTSFAISSLIGQLFSKSVDLIVVVSPPLQLGLTGWLLGVLKRAPFFFHIKDLVPDAAAAVGMLDERGWPFRIGRAMERFVYRRAKGIGVISPGFRANLVAKGVPAEKIALFPDYIDPRMIQPGPLVNGFRSAHGIRPESFVVMYSGSVAGKQGLETFLETADRLRAENDIVFYLIGEGPYLSELKVMHRKLGLSNFHFLPLQPRETMSKQFAAANALVVIQKKTVTDMVFPNKLLFYMAAARPVLAAVSASSETGRFITENRVGLVVPPEDPQALAAAIQQLKADFQNAQQLGQNARQVCIRNFDRETVLADFGAHLEKLAARQN